MYIEKKVKLELRHTNKVEFSRAINSGGIYGQIVIRELLQSSAEIFIEHFGSNQYSIFALTDPPRARTYRQNYGFKINNLENQDYDNSYLINLNGQQQFAESPHFQRILNFLVTQF